MSVTTVVTIAVILVAVVIIGTLACFYLQEHTLEEIRAEVYQLFLKAEHDPEFMESGKQKMKWVLSKARALLPGWASLFITDQLLEMVVQGWFDAVKDLLDDGKLNQSHREEV